uniref:DUF4283 domain-containing protein n=1 Tax=Chenopodium quinoa TaxID=63459 RepID=A0A803MRL9_CHEQI
MSFDCSTDGRHSMAHTRCNKYTVQASVNFDMTRLWIRVYGLPLGYLDPEWAFKTLDLIGLVETLEYDGDGLPDEPEFHGQVLVDLSKPLIPGRFDPGEFDPIWICFRNVYMSIDTGNCNAITFKELKAGLKRWFKPQRLEMCDQKSASYHNLNSTRFIKENRAAIPVGDPYAPLIEIRLGTNNIGEAFEWLQTWRKALFHMTRALILLLVSTVLQLLQSYDQATYFGYYGSTWSKKRRQIHALNLQGKDGFTMPVSGSRRLASHKCSSDVSTTAHFGFLGCSTDLACNPPGLKVFLRSKRKAGESSTASSHMFVKVSKDGFSS